jgi:hypothetical protein
MDDCPFRLLQARVRFGLAAEAPHIKGRIEGEKELRVLSIIVLSDSFREAHVICGCLYDRLRGVKRRCK